MPDKDLSPTKLRDIKNEILPMTQSPSMTLPKTNRKLLKIYNQSVRQNNISRNNFKNGRMMTE
jgi:hypothetical protein